MRTISYVRKTIALSSAAAALVTAVAAMAQPPEANRPAGRSLLAGAGGGRFAPAFDRFFEVLTDDQRGSFREAMDTQRDKARNLQEKLRDARKELMETGLAANFDEDTVRQKAMEAAKLEAEMTVLR